MGFLVSGDSPSPGTLVEFEAVNITPDPIPETNISYDPELMLLANTAAFRNPFALYAIAAPFCSVTFASEGPCQVTLYVPYWVFSQLILVGILVVEVKFAFKVTFCVTVNVYDGSVDKTMVPSLFVQFKKAYPDLGVATTVA